MTGSEQESRAITRDIRVRYDGQETDLSEIVDYFRESTHHVDYLEVLEPDGEKVERDDTGRFVRPCPECDGQVELLEHLGVWQCSQYSADHVYSGERWEVQK